MPLTELSIKGHLSKVEAPAQVSHGHCLGNPAEESRGKVHSSRMQQDLAGERLQLAPPRPQGSQPIRVILGVRTRMPAFSLNQCPFPILRKATRLGSFSMSHHKCTLPKNVCKCSRTQCRPQNKKGGGLRKSKGAALVFRNEIPGDTSKLSPPRISGLEEGAEER